MDTVKRSPFQPKNFNLRVLAIGLILLVVVIVSVLTAHFLRRSPQAINSAEYQVVYTTGGQAYFGKLQNTEGEYLVIKNPYTAQQVQQKDDSGKTTSAEATTLLKVSNQVYGPEDSIAIRSTQVSFWQNLRDDSKVTQAIKNKQ